MEREATVGRQSELATARREAALQGSEAGLRHTLHWNYGRSLASDNQRFTKVDDLKVYQLGWGGGLVKHSIVYSITHLASATP